MTKEEKLIEDLKPYMYCYMGSGMLSNDYDEKIVLENAKKCVEIFELYSQQVAKEAAADGWVSVEDRPLFTKDEKGIWTCTEDGDKPFIAAVPYNDSKRPTETNLWWIMPCIVEDNVGLCVIGDEENTPAGWQLEDVVYFKHLDLTAPNPKESEK